MARIIRVRGTEDGKIALSVDDHEPAYFCQDSDICADDLYRLFDYHAGDCYELEIGSSLEVPEAPFNYFAEFISNLTDAINSVLTQVDNDGDSACGSNDDRTE